MRAIKELTLELQKGVDEKLKITIENMRSSSKIS